MAGILTGNHINPTARVGNERRSMSQELQTQQNTQIGLTSLQGFELAQRAAKMLSSSSLVPKEYQGPQGMANCCIALNMAHRMGADPLMVMQNLVVVHGRPTWSSQFLIATFNSCGRFSAMRFEFFGDKGSDDYGCRAVATELATGERLSGTDVTIGIAKAEGWYGRNGSKWKTMPDQMLRYRAASWFVRTIAPELSMGLHTAEEVIDITDYQEIKPAQPRGKSVDELLNRNTDSAEEKSEDITDVDPETGEIIQPPQEPDPYTDLRIAINECQTLSDIARLLQEMKPEAKKDLAGDIRTRQNEIKAAQAQQV
jgi:hypothetical protein